LSRTCRVFTIALELLGTRVEFPLRVEFLRRMGKAMVVRAEIEEEVEEVGERGELIQYTLGTALPRSEELRDRLVQSEQERLHAEGDATA